MIQRWWISVLGVLMRIFLRSECQDEDSAEAEVVDVTEE